MAEKIINQIPLLSDCKEVIQITKGFSSDEKYLTVLEENKKLFLRLFNLQDIALKKEELSILEKMQEYNVACPNPVAVGEAGSKGYMITSYIEGEDAESEIRKYSDEEQFNIGIEAGKELKKMHQYRAPVHVSSWYSRKMEKHTNYINAYLTSGIRIKNDQQIMKFIDENIHLMKDRPNLFQHDDFHIGNIVVTNRKFAGIIDFNRFDWGDPVH